MNSTFYDAITDFVFKADQPAKADVIMIPGSSFPGTVKRAALLYREGYAPYVLPSGGFSKMTGHFSEPAQNEDPEYRERYQRLHARKSCLTEPAGQDPLYRTEWEYMRDILLDEGVPETAILREDRATFTWENAVFSRKVLEEKGIEVKTAILCCKSFHARRALTYYQQQFEEVRFLTVPVAAQGIEADNWFKDEAKTLVVLGELARMGMQFQCMLPIGRENRLLPPEQCVPEMKQA